MRLTIENFGPISRAELDLSKDFILIVGQNNIGKSYAISLVYAIVKTLNRFRRIGYYYYDEDLGNRPSTDVRKLAALISEQIVTSVGDIDLTQAIADQFKLAISSRIIPALQQTLDGTFSDVANLQNRRAESPLRVCLEDAHFSLELGVDANQLVIRKCDIKKHHFLVRKVKQNRTVKRGPFQTILYYPEGNPRHFEQSISALLRSLTSELVSSVCGTIFDFHYLPASRSGLYQSLSAFGQIVAELAKSRTALRQKIELPGISEPLSDYYLKLSDVRPQSPDPATQAFYEVAAEIESEILKGTVEFESKTRRLLFHPSGIDLSLDLSATSSMVSEISPIASYLKYVLPRSQSTINRVRQQSGALEEFSQLLILEEPEAHLHPQIQIRLISILAKLVETTRTKIILTSHSNYIFGKCSNLLISKGLDQERFEAILFQLGELGSTTRELDVGPLGISDENFVDVGEELYEERRRLINDLNHV